MAESSALRDMEAYLYRLPVEGRLAYSEKLLDDLTRSIWADIFSEKDKERMGSIANKTLRSVGLTRELALHILEE